MNNLHSDFTNQISPIMDKLHRYALQITKNSDDANDLVQDTLLRAYRYWHTIQPGNSLKAWLFTIMRNTFITQCARVKREHRVLVPKPFYELSDLTGGALSNEAISYATLDDIRAATDQLLTVHREPLLLHLDGFTYDEIARQLSLPMGTVKNRIFIARKRLKRQLQPYIS